MAVPPLFLALAVAAMLTLDRWLPGAKLLDAPWTMTALLPAIVGIILIKWSALLFLRAGTPLHPHRSATALIASGPYRWSRNPIYLGMALMLSGLWLGLGSLTPGLAVGAFVWSIERRFIIPEEAHLDRRFGNSYQAYKEAVRRWL